MARNYAREYKNYHSKKQQIKKRSSRNKARRIMKDVYGTKLKGKDVHHKDGNPLNNSKKNLRVTSKKYNRGKR